MRTTFRCVAVVQPGGETGLLAGGLPDNLQAEGMERGRTDARRVDPGCESGVYALLELGSGGPVEGQKQDAVRCDKAAADR